MRKKQSNIFRAVRSALNNGETVKCTERFLVSLPLHTDHTNHPVRKVSATACMLVDNPRLGNWHVLCGGKSDVTMV